MVKTATSVDIAVKAYKTVKKTIPQLCSGVAANSNLISFGLTLLLELTFIFLIQTQSDVMPTDLRSYLTAELAKILVSITRSDKLFFTLL
jgi:hypothetical protein